MLCLLLRLLWWGWRFARLAIDGVQEGPWAFRDGTQLIEALYLVVGFSLAATASDISRFSVWFRPVPDSIEPQPCRGPLLHAPGRLPGFLRGFWEFKRVQFTSSC